MDFSNYDNLDIEIAKLTDENFNSKKHSVHRKKRERLIRKKRKKASQIKAFLRFIVVCCLLVISYYLITNSQWYLPQDAFEKPLNIIEIENNNILPDKVIYEAIKKEKVPKLPIFLINPRKITRHIYKIPVVKKVYIRRYGFPAKFQVILRERTPIALIKTDLKQKPVAFYTEDGVLINTKNYMTLPENNILKILTNKNSIKKDITVKKIKEVEQIVKEVEYYSDEKVEYIDIRKPNDVFVKIPTANIRLGVLDSSINERIKRLYTILPQITKVDSQIQYIDLSWDKVNYLKLKKGK